MRLKWYTPATEEEILEDMLRQEKGKTPKLKTFADKSIPPVYPRSGEFLGVDKGKIYIRGEDQRIHIVDPDLIDA